MATLSREDIDRLVSGRTVASLFAETVAAYPDAVALRWKNADDSYGELTWTEYADQACRVAAGLAEAGIGKGDRVALMLRNRPEFHVADIAALLVGATPISIYNSSSPEQIQYLVSHCEAKLAIVEDPSFLERFLKVRTDLPSLEQLAIVDDRDGMAGDQVLHWEALLAHDPVDLAAASTIVQPDDLATVIYTSGTTGPPKGVMITHYNVAWTAESLRAGFGMEREELAGKRVVSYLPMAHIAERMTSHYNGIYSAFECTTCPDPGLIATYMRETKPHVGFGVPRVWEKIYSGVTAALSADPEKGAKFDEAVAAAKPLVAKRTLEGADALTAEETETLAFLDAVAFGPVRALVGMDEMEFAITGAAPIPLQLIEWFRTIGVPLSEIYGMSENTGPLTWDAYRVKPGSVGRALPGVEVALADDGEVVARGGNVFPGYLNDPEKTADALDADGWLHTGDIGQFDDEGYLKIVDRKKELIITAGGKNISPANLEAALKMAPLIGQVCVIGDNRPFISALVTLDPEVAPAWAKQHGIEVTSIEALAEEPAVLEEIERSRVEANTRFSQVEQIKKIRILPSEWLPDSEELTPTMKLKRRGVHSKYADEIEQLYAK